MDVEEEQAMERATRTFLRMPAQTQVALLSVGAVDGLDPAAVLDVRTKLIAQGLLAEPTSASPSSPR